MSNSFSQHDRLLNLHPLPCPGGEPETVLKPLQFSPPPAFEGATGRGPSPEAQPHLLEELSPGSRNQTPSSCLGSAHMPGIAAGLRAAGFRLSETRDYTVIHFRSPGSKAGHPILTLKGLPHSANLRVFAAPPRSLRSRSILLDRLEACRLHDLGSRSLDRLG